MEMDSGAALAAVWPRRFDLEIKVSVGTGSAGRVTWYFFVYIFFSLLFSYSFDVVV